MLTIHQELRPNGPYRSGAYSAGVFIGLGLARLLEENGDEIIQLSLIDHFPLVLIASPQPLGVENRDEYVSYALYNLADAFRRDQLPRRRL